jgi:hypothetical protein
LAEASVTAAARARTAVIIFIAAGEEARTGEYKIGKLETGAEPGKCAGWQERKVHIVDREIPFFMFVKVPCGEAEPVNSACRRAWMDPKHGNAGLHQLQGSVVYST